jgi:hypothetical protein
VAVVVVGVAEAMKGSHETVIEADWQSPPVVVSL